MDEMDKLKPCPFCGGEADLIEIKSLPTFSHYIARCKDPRCAGFTFHQFYNREMAITAWNRRADNG